MKNTNFLKVTSELISAILLIILIYDATHKLAEPELFKIALRQSPPLQKSSGIISVALPSIEILVAMLLIMPKYRDLGLLSSASLYCAFNVYIWTMMVTQTELPCNCGGLIKSLSWKAQMFVNLFLISMTLFALWLRKTYLKILLQ